MGVLILILTVILEYVQKLFQMERFVGLSLKQGMENRGIRESGNPAIGESGNHANL